MRAVLERIGLARPRVETVLGRRVPEPRVTAAGVGLALLYLGAPALAAILALDLLVWAIGWAAFDVCLAVWCLF
ncbi:MAG: hypothetical protein AAFR16_02235 [Pseudomonadota bacterium]